MADGLLGALSSDDKTLGLIAAGIGLLSGNQGRNRRDAFGNAMGGGLHAGAGILNPIMQMQQIQGMKQDRESQRKLQERGVAVQELLAKDNDEMKKLQIAQLRSQQAAREALLGMPQTGGQPGTMAPGPDGTQIGIPGQAPTVPGVQFGGQPAPQGMPQGMPPQTGLNPTRIQQAYAAGLPVADLIKLYELQNPELKIENGVALNPRQLSHGQAVPGLRMGQGGEAMMQIPDPSAPGGVRVAAPPGALDAFAQFQQIRNRSGAEYGRPVEVQNPDGTVTLQTPTQFRDTATGSAPSLRVSPQQQGQRDQARVSVLQAERAAAIARGDSAAVADLDRELGATRLPGVRSGMTSQQRATSDAARARAVNTAEADVAIGKQGVSDVQKEASAWANVGNLVSQIEERLNDKDKYGGVLGVTPGGRIQGGLHTLGIQTLSSINTQAIQQLGQSLVLSRGSLGAGVSVADAERYDKAAGSFSTAKSEADMRASIEVMKDIQKKYAEQANRMMNQFRETGRAQAPSMRPKPGDVIGGYRFKGGNLSDQSNWEPQ